MRLPILIAALLALPPAVAAAHAAPDRAAPDRNDRHPLFVREPDGSTIIRMTLPAFPAELDESAAGPFRVPDTDPVAPSPLGRRRSPSEQAIDEDLERAFEEAADIARFGAPD